MSDLDQEELTANSKQALAVLAALQETNTLQGIIDQFNISANRGLIESKTDVEIGVLIGQEIGKGHICEEDSKYFLTHEGQRECAELTGQAELTDLYARQP